MGTQIGGLNIFRQGWTEAWSIVTRDAAQHGNSEQTVPSAGVLPFLRLIQTPPSLGSKPPLGQPHFL